MKIKSLKLLVWVAIVYLLSFLCYLPMMLEIFGVVIPKAITFVKYLFIFVPIVISIFYMIHEQNFKKVFTQNFSKKIKMKDFFMLIIFTIFGLSLTIFYSSISGNDVLKENYPSIMSVFSGCIYLFFTGLVEEVAWRGYFLEKVTDIRKGIAAIILVGITWAIWHLPMWAIRNSLGILEIFQLIIWTILVSVILGIVYCKNKNIIVIASLHMIFNTCFLAPVLYNIALLITVILIAALYGKIKNKNIKNS